MKLNFECTYCGNVWNAEFYSKERIEAQICPKCKDQTIKVKDTTNRINYYIGTPPFPDEVTTSEDWNWASDVADYAEGGD